MPSAGMSPIVNEDLAAAESDRIGALNMAEIV
jgi:hypothetical protein